MRTSSQVALSILLVGAAATVVIVQLRSDERASVAVEDGGHDHAAMMAGSSTTQPVVLDAEASRRIGVTFATVEHRELTEILRTVGTVAYDETRLSTVNPKVDGWVEDLLVDFTGAPVQEGQTLLRMYSPALVSAQEELILASRMVRNAAEGRARANATELLTSSRRRLAYWDIPEDEILRIEESGEPSRTMTLTAPATGIVVEKNVIEGDRIMPGMTVYRIADLTRVWIEAEVFEKDLARVAEGQRATVAFEAYPGRVFNGQVTYVHPTVSVQSRTARVRLELPNRDLLLRPGMYAQVELESLPRPATLVVPRGSVIQTGERALVFVQSADGTLMPREVIVGRASGRFMEILEGLVMGERIVSSAAFLVDAESNLGTMTGDVELGMEGMEGMPGMPGMEGMDPPMDPVGAEPDTAGVDHSAHTGSGR